MADNLEENDKPIIDYTPMKRGRKIELKKR